LNPLDEASPSASLPFHLFFILARTENVCNHLALQEKCAIIGSTFGTDHKNILYHVFDFLEGGNIMEKTRKDVQGKKILSEAGEHEDLFDEVMADMNHATYKAGLDQ
jgi:hypothetical protein